MSHQLNVTTEELIRIREMAQAKSDRQVKIWGKMLYLIADHAIARRRADASERSELEQLRAVVLEAERAIEALLLGVSINNSRFPEKRIEGPLWRQAAEVVKTIRRMSGGGDA